jgi:protein gp37
MNVQGEHGINWTDATWNPVTGCRHDCPYCYARENYRRFNRSFEPAFHPEALREPIARHKPTKIFVGSTADVFGAWVPRDWIEQVLNVVRKAPQHTFQFLTKNPQRLAEFRFPDNAWAGATIDVRARLKPTLEALRHVQAPVRFISFEPLNGDMGVPLLAGAVEWIIIGAQTGHGAHQPEEGWVDDLVSAATAARVAIWFKDNLIREPRINDWPRSAPMRQMALAL